MAYTRLAYNAANLTWLGALAYTRPTATTANLSFASPYPQVSGFMPVRFGTIAGLSQVASVIGIAPVAFGTPIALVTMRFAFGGIEYSRPVSVDFSWAPPGPVGLVSGFMPVRIGAIVALYNQFNPVTGTAHVAFGTPIARLTQPITGFAPLQLGGPLTLLPHAVGFTPVHWGAIHLLPHAVGWKPTSFGTFGRRNVNRVRGFRSCHFGGPTAPTARVVAVHGLHAIKPGHPVAIRYIPL